MSTVPTAVAESTSHCCLWFDKSQFDPRQQRCVAQMTLLIISIIALSLSIFLTLVSTGVLWETYPLYSLNDVAVFGSGILLTLNATATLISLGILFQQYCIKS